MENTENKEISSEYHLVCVDKNISRPIYKKNNRLFGPLLLLQNNSTGM